MSAFNAESRLEKTLESILNQSFTNFEFIVVDDGSTDLTSRILADYAKTDNRLRIVQQENTGLTVALIRACALAKGNFIARQDAGDVSFADRFEIQCSLFEEYPEAVMVGGGANFRTSNGENLFCALTPGLELDTGLRKLRLGDLKGPPHHGATMFRREAYRLAGGYRPEFRVAQDIDLWLRLAEKGQCVGTSEILYDAILEPNSISINRHSEQLFFQNLAIECARLRTTGCDDVGLISNLNYDSQPSSARYQLSAYHYFIASCLKSENKKRIKYHLNLALKYNPLHLKAALRRLAWVFK